MYIITPPKKAHTKRAIAKIQGLSRRMGYDYECNDSKTMKWMKEEFDNKTAGYIGNQYIAAKQGRMDKIRLKEQLNFKIQVNPLVKTFSRLNTKVEKMLLF